MKVPFEAGVEEVASGRRKVASGQWSVVRNEVVSGEWAVVRSVGSEQPSGFSEKRVIVSFAEA
jgi:hypothetical protein